MKINDIKLLGYFKSKSIETQGRVSMLLLLLKVISCEIWREKDEKNEEK